MDMKASSFKKVNLSYKAKLILFLLLVIAVTNTVFSVIRGRMIRNNYYKNAQQQLSESLTLNRKCFLSDVAAERKLALQTAKLPSMISYCKNPKNPALAQSAQAEMEAFANTLDIGLTFYVSDVDKHFYYVPSGVNFIVDPNNPEYYWYNMTLGMPLNQDYNFNINYAAEIGKTQLWMNAVIRDENGKAIGLSGSGVNLSDSISSIFDKVNADVTMYLFNDSMEIVGSRDLNQVENKELITSVFNQKVIDSISERVKQPGFDVTTFRDGATSYALCEMPEIGWYMIASKTYYTRYLFVGEGCGQFYLILLLLCGIAIFVGKMIWFFHNIQQKEIGLGNQLFTETQALVVTTKETAATSQDQSAAVKEIVATMEDSNALSENITQKVKDVADVAQKTTCDVSDGAAALATNVQKLHEIFEANQQTISGIKTLGDKIENIWDIVTLINSVADQAKIIAFNAELEAASAGEAGKNFHIVASEIRRLADSIIDGTKEIKEKINEIQQSSDSLIIASESGTERINEGCDAAKELEENFASIRSAAEITATSASDITDIIQQQTVGSGQILITLKQIAAGVENFTAATENISTSAQNLKVIAGNLTESVNSTNTEEKANE